MLALEIFIGKLCDTGRVSACKKYKVCLVIRTSIAICIKMSEYQVFFKRTHTS